MDAVPSFAESVGAIASQLREMAPSHSVLNRSASQIDGLGRRLHGLGLAHDREIAGCLAAAIRELIAAHVLPEEKRAEPVSIAVGQLESALHGVVTGELAP